MGGRNKKRGKKRDAVGRTKKEAKNHLKITVARPLVRPGVLNFLPRDFTGRQLGPLANKNRTVSFALRVFREMVGA